MKYPLAVEVLPADVVPGNMLEFLPDAATLAATLPKKLGTYKRKDVCVGLHKRVAFVAHGDSKVVYVPQGNVDSITLEMAIQFLDKPPAFPKYPRKTFSRTKYAKKKS